jgi:ketosteroid isomerase-like protein
MSIDEVDEQFATEFAQRFADAWRNPTMDKFEVMFSDAIVLRQPMMGTLRGKQACRASFEQLFALVPDLHADVHRVGHGKCEVFIEFTLSGTYGGKPISWDAVDRMTFTNGLIAERVSYFDSAPLAVKLVARPRGWNRLARTGATIFKR